MKSQLSILCFTVFDEVPMEKSEPLSLLKRLERNKDNASPQGEKWRVRSALYRRHMIVFSTSSLESTGLLILHVALDLSLTLGNHALT